MDVETVAIISILCLSLLISGWIATSIRSIRAAVTRARGRPRTKATIVRSAITVRSMGRAGRQYQPAIVYQFDWDGRRFQGTRRTVDLQIWYTRRRTAERILARYPVGALVDVWVDTTDPSLSVLEPEAPYLKTLWTLLAVDWIIALVGAVVLRFWSH
jgi:hypothetical protein